MHNPTDRLAHTTDCVAPVVEHWLERSLHKKPSSLKPRIAAFIVLAVVNIFSYIPLNLMVVNLKDTDLVGIRFVYQYGTQPRV